MVVGYSATSSRITRNTEQTGAEATMGEKLKYLITIPRERLESPRASQKP